jgi:NAD(P)H-dependent FMN reductase
MENLSIVVIEGTTRQERKSIHAARLIAEIGRKIAGVSITFVDPLTMPLPYNDGNNEANKIPEWAEINRRADAYFIITPEYNHSFPGSLKKLLDNDLGNYTHKPVALAGMSSSPWGGVRAVESLVNVVRELGMVATFADVYFPKVDKLFDEQGQLQDQSYVKMIENAYQELIWMAKVLKQGRENTPPVDLTKQETVA